MKPMELWNTYMYLRKSRKDEQHLDEPIEVTLARHHDTLNRLAKAKSLNVVKVYKEVQTGDSIAVRPMMLELLADIEEGLVDQGIFRPKRAYHHQASFCPRKTGESQCRQLYRHQCPIRVPQGKQNPLHCGRGSQNRKADV